MHKFHLHNCIICTGSNHNARYNTSRLEEILGGLFPDISWGEAIETPAEPSKPSGPDQAPSSRTYINRAARFSTPLSLEELNSVLKEVEISMGRSIDMRRAGIVPADIDILVYDSIIIRPEDMKRKYVIMALNSLDVLLQ